MKIIWHSNAGWNSSGYGIETALFVPRIASLGHEIICAAPYSFSGPPLEWEGFTVLPCARDAAGNDTIVANHEYFKADLTITLADPFGLEKAAETLSQVNIAHWFPVDCSPLGRADVKVLREGMGVPVAMSRFGERVLADEGCEPLYVPHGVDTGVFKPGDRRPYRDTLPGVTDDTFVIGLCAMNRDPNRKGFQEQFLAFADFHRRHPDSFLAVHSSPGGGLNLNAMAARLGITAATGFPDSYSYDMGLITSEAMAAWYNGLDVLSLCSYGEGFGLPLLEAQACGVPVVTTDASATSELCGAGWLVSGTPFWTDGHQSWWTRPDIADIENAYEAAWQARENGALPKKEAREFALGYDADRVFEVFWKPCLDRLEERTGYPGRVFATARDGYEDRLSRWSDIQEYLPFLHATAVAYPGVRVLELGSRRGNSTMAFLAAAEEAGGHVTSVDIDPVADDPRGLARQKDNPRWTFVHGDDLHPAVRARLPAQADVLFVDTSHGYRHTLDELRAYMPRVAPGGVALFHDTRVFGDWSEPGDAIPPVARALNDWCAETGMAWENLEGVYGLGVIRVDGKPAAA